jgi:hypothetical protein
LELYSSGWGCGDIGLKLTVPNVRRSDFGFLSYSSDFGGAVLCTTSSFIFPRRFDEEEQRREGAYVRKDSHCMLASVLRIDPHSGGAPKSLRTNPTHVPSKTFSVPPDAGFVSIQHRLPLSPRHEARQR